MFIVSWLHKVFAAPEERNVADPVAYNISLLWSSRRWVTFRSYKHSAPLELSSLGYLP
jgi:hypothetical protein